VAGRGELSALFGSVQDEIAPIMEAAGAQDDPGITFWRKLETHDDHGWD
jgi:hypothetical protein